MEFSDIIPQAVLCKFAHNSAFFAYSDNTKIYVKESSVNLNNFCVISVSTKPSELIISPNSELIAIYFKEKGIALVYNIKGNIVAKIEDNQSGISGIIWSPDSVQLLVFSELLYKCSIYNLVDKSISYIRSPKLSNSKGCIFSSNGKLMALLQRHDCKDTISIYYCGDWKLVNCIPVQSFDIIEIKWGLNDSHIVAWQNPINYKFYAICPYKGVIFRYQPYEYALGIKSVQYSNRSLFVGIGSFDQKVRIINAMTWKVIAELDCSNPIITSDNTKIYKEEDTINSKRVKTIDRFQYKIPVIKPSLNDKGPIAQGISILQFNYDDNFLACKNDNMPYTAWIWNMSTLQVQTIISLNSPIKMMKWHKEENSLCITCGNEKIIFWKDDAILQCSFPIETCNFKVQRFIWSTDCKRMLLLGKGEAIYADLV